MEKVKDPSIQIGMLFIVRECHDVWVLALIDPILVLLHVIGGVCELERLMLIEGIGLNLHMASIIIGELLVGCDVWIWCCGPPCDVVLELPPKPLVMV
jgi:hypothetical protein